MTTAAPEVAGLSPSEKRHAAAWTLSKSGGTGGEAGEVFVPQAVRLVELEDRVRYALDPALDAAWMERERRRVVASPVYFTEAYGHVQPPTGPPIPFELWELVELAAEAAIGATTQAEVLEILWREKRILMLKARQLGITWLVLHFAYWVLAFREDTPRARILALSKHGGDASKLLERVRRIQELLPPFLRHAEDRETRGSKTELALEGRGRIVSLAGDPAAARMETATLAIVDELAFVRNGQAGPTLTALQPTIGETGQEILLSTGNGRTGDGQAFAEEVDKALDGKSSRYFVFLPASTDPDRADPDWRDKARGRYRSDEDFEQEHPENVDQALGGEGVVKIYPAEHLAAAAKLGAALVSRQVAIAKAEGVELGTDWGDFQTFTTYGLPLAGGGIYAIDELLQSSTEPVEASEAILDRDPGGLGDELGQPVVRSRSSADLAPPGTNKTFAKVLAGRRNKEPALWPETHVSVPFGVYKEGGGQGRKGVNTIGYLRRLAKKSFEFTQAEGWEERLDEAAGVLAIGPRCNTLLAQMRDLERDPKTGKVRKPDPDPKRPEKGDHGADSMVALGHRRAELWTATLDEGS